MKKKLNTEKYGYILTEKQTLSTCSIAVKKPKIRKILKEKVIKECICVNKSNYKPVISNLHYSYSRLIGIATSISIEIICDIYRHKKYTGKFEKEIAGMMACETELDLKYYCKYEHHRDIVLDFKHHPGRVQMHTLENTFRYALYMAIFESIYRGEDANNIFSIDESMYPYIIDEVRKICKVVYMDLITANKESIKTSFLGNPIFGTRYSGIRGDGDIMIGNALYDLKTKKSSEPLENDICQLALYYLLSRSKRILKSNLHLEITQEDLVNKMYIYNTRHGNTYEVKVNKLSGKEVDEIMAEIYEVLKMDFSKR